MLIKQKLNIHPDLLFHLSYLSCSLFYVWLLHWFGLQEFVTDVDKIAVKTELVSVL